MDPEEFRDGPGSVETHDGLPCYRPDSLPPELTYTDDLVRVYGDAQYALGRLATLHRDIENENLLIAPFVVREAAMSSQIEGTNVTVSDIILHDIDGRPRQSAVDRDDVREAYNYVDAIKQGFQGLDDSGITLDLVCSLHETLLGGVRGSHLDPGRLRDVPVYIGSPSGTPQDARFVPASPDTVPVLMEQLTSYIRNGAYPPLIDIALTHYQFETIHPFRDGNGRIGRLLIMLQMYQAGLLPEPYLYLSAYFNRHRQTYIDLLLSVSKTGAWTEWTTFVLDAVANQAIDAYDSGVKLKDLRNTYHQKYPRSPAVRDVIDHVFEEPYLTAPRAIQRTGRSKQAVYDAIEELQAEGMIEEITDSERNRVFRAPEILDVVESP